MPVVNLPGIFQTWAKIIEAPPVRSPIIWAEENRILPPGEAEPGPYRAGRVPFLHEIGEAVLNPMYSRVVIAKGAQLGLSEFAINCIGWKLDDAPTPIIYTAPTQRLVESISSNRVAKMLDSVPSLLAKKARGKKDKIGEKIVAGVRLGFAWAGSATELSSHPAGFAVVDEIDRMPRDVGGEGDPAEIVDARGTTYVDFVNLIISTPTILGASPILALLDEGTNQKWHIPCPNCNGYFLPTLEVLKYTEVGKTIRNVHLFCFSCGYKIGDRHRLAMNARGLYLGPGQTFEGGRVLGDLEANETASFWISGLCSPWRTYERAAARYVKALRSHKQERIQAAINTIFGEGYQIKGEAPTWQAVKELCQGYESGAVPEETTVLTCGVDVHKDDLHYSIRAWGYRGESWTVESGVIYGDTDKFDVWEDFQEQILGAEFEVEKGYFHIRLVAVDSGYRPYMVYMFSKKNTGRVIAVKGRESESVTAPVRVSKIEYNYKGKAIPGGVRLFVFDDGYFKSQLHSKIHRAGDGAGSWHLPGDVTEDYCRQMVAEEIVTTSGGRRVWVKVSKNNHFLDVEKLNEMCGEVLRVSKIKAPKAGESNKTRVISKGLLDGND